MPFGIVDLCPSQQARSSSHFSSCLYSSHSSSSHSLHLQRRLQLCVPTAGGVRCVRRCILHWKEPINGHRPGEWLGVSICWCERALARKSVREDPCTNTQTGQSEAHCGQMLTGMLINCKRSCSWVRVGWAQVLAWLCVCVAVC